MQIIKDLLKQLINKNILLDFHIIVHIITPKGLDFMQYFYIQDDTVKELPEIDSDRVLFNKIKRYSIDFDEYYETVYTDKNEAYAALLKSLDERINALRLKYHTVIKESADWVAHRNVS